MLENYRAVNNIYQAARPRSHQNDWSSHQQPNGRSRLSRKMNSSANDELVEGGGYPLAGSDGSDDCEAVTPIHALDLILPNVEVNRIGLASQRKANPSPTAVRSSDSSVSSPKAPRRMLSSRRMVEASAASFEPRTRA